MSLKRVSRAKKSKIGTLSASFDLASVPLFLLLDPALGVFCSKITIRKRGLGPVADTDYFILYLILGFH